MPPKKRARGKPTLEEPEPGEENEMNLSLEEPEEEEPSDEDENVPPDVPTGAEADDSLDTTGESGAPGPSKSTARKRPIGGKGKAMAAAKAREREREEAAERGNIRTVKVVNRQGANRRELSFIVKDDTPVQRIMDGFCDKFKIRRNSFRFFFDGKVLEPRSSAKKAGLKKDAVIECFQYAENG